MLDPPLNFPLNPDTNAICQIESELGRQRVFMQKIPLIHIFFWNWIIEKKPRIINH